MVTNLNHLIRKTNTKLFFRVECVTDLNAMRGFMGALGIKKRQVVIRCDLEMTQAAAKKVLKGCAFTTRRAPLKNWLPVIFDTEGPARLASDGSLVVNYDPYKYFVPVGASKNEKTRLRAAMKIEKGRKIILVSCSARDEVRAILETYRRLDLFVRPLLILGLRRSDASLQSFLSRRGFKTHDRRSPKQALSYFGESDVVVLNTRGELIHFLKAADLAVVGHDRNIFEPALLGIPILYFGRPLNMNRNDKQMASLFGLFWRKNRTAKNLLDRTGGARRIDPASFHRQVTNMLRFPDKVIRGGRKAVRLFRRQALPADRLRGTRLLVSAVLAKASK